MTTQELLQLLEHVKGVTDTMCSGTFTGSAGVPTGMSSADWYNRQAAAELGRRVLNAIGRVKAEGVERSTVHTTERGGGFRQEIVEPDGTRIVVTSGEGSPAGRTGFAMTISPPKKDP